MEKSTLSPEVKSVLDAISTGVAGHGETIKNLQRQLDGIDERLQHKNIFGRPGGDDFMATLTDSTELKSLRERGRGSARVSIPGAGLKTLITSDTVGRATSGVIQVERVRQDVVAAAQRPLTLLDLIATRPTSAGICDFIRVVNPMASAASQSPEGAAKHENAITFEAASERVRTIATWIPATRQVLEDGPALEAAIRGALGYAVRSGVEEQALNGNGLGETLAGIIPQATAFDTALLPGTGAGPFTMIDVIGAAVSQIASANEIAPTFVVVHPTDLWAIRMTKDSQGRYILGDPQQPGPLTVFGLLLIGSTAIEESTFLVGSSDPAAIELVERMGLVVEISTEHEDYFVKNKVALRAETRVALLVYRPGSFITGGLFASPAA
jgi:HK97 family phage major capsid protein